MKTSESIAEIAKAMVEVEKDIKGIVPNGDNPFFKSKYITIDNILEVTRPILAKQGIWLIQEVTGDAESIAVTSRLAHTSGEFIETDVLRMKPAKAIDPQQLGSCATYARRYQLAAFLGISSEVDDDGDSATFGLEDPKKITKVMVEELRALCKEKNVTEAYICKFKGVNKFEDLTSGAFVQARDWLKKK